MHHRFNRLTGTQLNSALTILHAGLASTPAVFEVRSPTEHIMAGSTRLVSTISRYSMAAHLYTNRAASSGVRYADLVFDWFAARGSDKYMGTLSTFGEGLSVPANVPLAQTVGNLLEGYMLGPIITSILGRSLATATAAWKIQNALGRELTYVCSASPVEDMVTMTTDAAACFSGGFGYVDDTDAARLYNIPRIRPLLDLTAAEFFSNEEDAWRLHWDLYGNDSFIEVADVSQASRLLQLSEKEQLPLGALVVPGNVKDYRRLIVAHKGWEPALYLKSASHKACIALGSTLASQIDGIIYQPGADRDLITPPLAYDLVELDGKATKGFPLGRSYPIRTRSTHEITVHSYKELLENPTPLRQGAQSPVMFPAIRSGVADVAFDLSFKHLARASKRWATRFVRGGEHED